MKAFRNEMGTGTAKCPIVEKSSSPGFLFALRIAWVGTPFCGPLLRNKEANPIGSASR